MTFDTHKFYKHLKASKMPDSWADSITVGFSEAQRTMQVASKKDLSVELVLPVIQQLKSLETNVVKKIAYTAMFLILFLSVFILLQSR